MTHELKTGGDRGYLRIATEEAFATQEQFDAIMRLVNEGRADQGTMSLWGFYGTSASERTTFIRERLLDLGELRLQAMDEAGIDKAVLALTSPGTQSMHDADEAKRIAGNANDQLKDACERLSFAGVPLGNQSVLLKGVNDDADVMKALVHRLLRMRVRPYYIYQMDLITGGAHFKVDVRKGIEIIRALRGHTTGYAVPQYVIDAPGGGGKVPVNPDYVEQITDDEVIFRNFEGKQFRYPLKAEALPEKSAGLVLPAEIHL